jgi:hypothetical protein
MSQRRDWTSCKESYKRKGSNTSGPDDYLSPEAMRKILERKPEDAKADAEWRRSLRLTKKVVRR